MNFFVVYCKNLKRFQKYVKSNNLKNKYILDVRKIIESRDIDVKRDTLYLKSIIHQKIISAMDKKKDIYYIPDFSSEFSIDKLLNLRKLLGSNDFNILVFYNEFKNDSELLEGIISNLTRFSNSQILRDC